MHRRTTYQARVTNYLTVPNPINMCQPHLGRIERIHTKLHLQTDMMHVVKCLLGTGIRLTNWVILAHLMLKVAVVMHCDAFVMHCDAA